MPRQVLKAAGVVTSVAGLAVTIASLAVPWVTYRVSGTAVQGIPVSQSGSIAVFQIPNGTLYVLAALLLVGLVALAALGTGPTTTIALTAAPILGAATLLLVGFLASSVAASASKVIATGVAELSVTGEAAGGVPLGLLAGPLMATGAWLLAYCRREEAAPVESLP
jgi:hypothetical protein